MVRHRTLTVIERRCGTVSNAILEGLVLFVNVRWPCSTRRKMFDEVMSSKYAAVSRPAKGTVFRHDRFLDSETRNGKMMMRVTAVRGGVVYFTHADSLSNKGLWYLPVDDWLQRFENRIVGSDEVSSDDEDCDRE